MLLSLPSSGLSAGESGDHNKGGGLSLGKFTVGKSCATLCFCPLFATQ